MGRDVRLKERIKKEKRKKKKREILSMEEI